jgi:hypothetical protein
VELNLLADKCIEEFSALLSVSPRPPAATAPKAAAVQVPSDGGAASDGATAAAD